ncbi:hypothetical protein SAMN05444064_118116 [Pseudomonas syringae]|nr:hypothetical protein SAMN05444514_118116 [Pseudomonas syringae]SFM48442.1 hypothetical protein SAMN05444064_118116 [Pseudomonas syringae]
MSLAIVHSRTQVGVEAPAVTVEAHLTNGLPALTLTGLPAGAFSLRFAKNSSFFYHNHRCCCRLSSMEIRLC